MAVQSGILGRITSKSHHTCVLALSLLGSVNKLNMVGVSGVGQVLSDESGQTSTQGTERWSISPFPNSFGVVGLGYSRFPLTFLSL
jgi:hypothetical protein